MPQGLRFAVDLLYVDLQKGTLTTASLTQDTYELQWDCSRDRSKFQEWDTHDYAEVARIDSDK